MLRQKNKTNNKSRRTGCQCTSRHPMTGQPLMRLAAFIARLPADLLRRPGAAELRVHQPRVVELLEKTGARVENRFWAPKRRGRVQYHLLLKTKKFPCLWVQFGKFGHSQRGRVPSSDQRKKTWLLLTRVPKSSPSCGSNFWNTPKDFAKKRV